MIATLGPVTLADEGADDDDVDDDVDAVDDALPSMISFCYRRLHPYCSV